MKILRNPAGREKMSEVIGEFAQPWMDLVRTDEDYATILRLAIIAWNSAHLAEQERFEGLDPEMVKALGEPGMKLLRSMIDYKLAHYSDYNRPILDYEISGAGPNLRLEVVSSVPDPEKFLGTSQIGPA